MQRIGQTRVKDVLSRYATTSTRSGQARRPGAREMQASLERFGLSLLGAPSRNAICTAISHPKYESVVTSFCEPFGIVSYYIPSLSLRIMRVKRPGWLTGISLTESSGNCDKDDADDEPKAEHKETGLESLQIEFRLHFWHIPKSA